MQNTVGKLMERIVATHETRQRPRGERDTLCKSLGGGGGGGGGADQENAHGKVQLHLQMTCTKDSSEKNKQRLCQSISRMLKTESSSSCWWTCTSSNDGVNLTLTRWIAGALLERTVVMQLGNWSFAPHQLTIGLPGGHRSHRSSWMFTPKA